MFSLSPNTQAILLLTAPLIVGRGKQDVAPLTPAEYRRIAHKLHELNFQPSDLLEAQSDTLLMECARLVDPQRIKRLLGRGFLLSQAVDRWRARAIWVLSRADPEYPRRLKSRAREDAPPVIYGCGDPAPLGRGGLAIVGSRHVDEELTRYAEAAGRLAVNAGYPVVSGGARGVDQSAMRGAVEAGGLAVGVLADSLEKTALKRDHRAMLMNGQIVLLSPYDPSAGFNVGHAMGRNKLIYALADAALVISSDYEKGGTWAGASEQLEKLHFVPIFVRVSGAPQKGLEALRTRGALPWPESSSPEEIATLLQSPPTQGNRQAMSDEPEFSFADEPVEPTQSTEMSSQQSRETPEPSTTSPHAADELFAKVRDILLRTNEPRTEQEVATDLNVSSSQARAWLHRLVEEGILEKSGRPIRYRSTARTGSLFDLST